MPNDCLYEDKREGGKAVEEEVDPAHQANHLGRVHQGSLVTKYTIINIHFLTVLTQGTLQAFKEPTHFEWSLFIIVFMVLVFEPEVWFTLLSPLCFLYAEP